MKKSLIYLTLKVIEESGEGVSFLNLLERIPYLKKERKEDWIKLRAILTALIEDDFIEERHSLGGTDKMVDYYIEGRGIEFLRILESKK